jgi:phytanoyl-CoA hydroxylase
MGPAPVEKQGTDGPPDGLYQFERTANKRVGTVDDITEADLGFFREHGYLVVDDVLDEAEVAAVKQEMRSLLAETNRADTDLPENIVSFEDGVADDTDDLASLPPEEQLDYVRKFWQFSEHSEPMRAPSERADLQDLLSTLVDGEPSMFQDMALVKPPRCGSEKPWHQDKAYFDVALDAPVVGVWIALDEATPENGCMHIVPGSHRDGPVTHFDRRDWQICDTDVQADEDVMVPLDPGGALLFDGLLHHGTPPNRSDRRRRALQFHYTAAGAEWVDDGHPEFDSEGKDVEC